MKRLLSILVLLLTPLGSYAQEAPAGTVAIIDDGVDTGHPALQAAFMKDAQGVVLGQGYDRYFPVGPAGGQSPKASPLDLSDAHGTFLAGVVAGVGNPEDAVQAGEPPVRILPVRATTVAGVVAAIDYVAARGVRIVNLSLGTAADSAALREAIARHPDCAFVVSAGNHGQDLANSPYFPASFDEPNILRVGAVNEAGIPLPYSNYGRKVQYAAWASPSAGLAPGGGEIELGGTSLAAARVSRLAALVAREGGAIDGAAEPVENPQGPAQPIWGVEPSIHEDYAPHIPGQMILAVEDGVPGDAALESLHESFAGRPGEGDCAEIRPGLYLVKLPLRYDVSSACARAVEIPGVRYAEPNFVLEPQGWEWVDKLKSKVASAAGGAWEAAKYTGSQVYHFGKGFVGGVKGTAVGLYQFARHPVESVKAIGAAIENYPQTWDLIKEKWGEYMDAMHNDPAKFAEMTGALTAEVMLAVAGTKGLDKLSKAKLVAQAGQVVKASRPVVALSRAGATTANAVKTVAGKVPGGMLAYRTTAAAGRFTGRMGAGLAKSSWLGLKYGTIPATVVLDEQLTRAVQAYQTEQDAQAMIDREARRFVSGFDGQRPSPAQVDRSASELARSFTDYRNSLFREVAQAGERFNADVQGLAKKGDQGLSEESLKTNLEIIYKRFGRAQIANMERVYAPHHPQGERAPYSDPKGQLGQPSTQRLESYQQELDLYRWARERVGPEAQFYLDRRIGDTQLRHDLEQDLLDSGAFDPTKPGLEPAPAVHPPTTGAIEALRRTGNAR